MDSALQELNCFFSKELQTSEFRCVQQLLLYSSGTVIRVSV